MTTLSTHTAENAGARRAIVPVGIGSFAAAAFWIGMGAHDVGEVVSMVALCAVVAGGVFGFVLPRAMREESAPGRALTLSILGLLLIVPAFWSGLPMVLGAAGALLGYAGRNASAGAKGSVTALVVGLLAVAGYWTTYISDQFFL
jgi:hypothetical protein